MENNWEKYNLKFKDCEGLIHHIENNVSLIFIIYNITHNKNLIQSYNSKHHSKRRGITEAVEIFMEALKLTWYSFFRKYNAYTYVYACYIQQM